MRRRLWWIVSAIQAALTIGVLALLRSGRVPMGVRGEWEWLRVSAAVAPELLAIAAMAVGIYIAYASVAMRSIERSGKAGPWLVGLVPLAVVAQVGVQEGAPPGYGLVKSAFALPQPGSSGYYTVAKREIGDLPAFLASYPEWIAKQDALHIGTHPPGLFVASWGMLRAMESRPDQARAIAGFLPKSFHFGFETVGGRRGMPAADRAALAMTGLFVLIACAMTCVPVYWLARANCSASAAWASASIWPLVPAALMFQPTADTAFPLLATLSLALAAWSRRWRWMAVAAGVVLGVGTQLTLAFFPVGLVAGVVLLQRRERPDASPTSTPHPTLPLKGGGNRHPSNGGDLSPPPLRGRVGWGVVPGSCLINIALTGLGFLAVTLAFWMVTKANPFAIWRTNALNHARFYEEFPRSYLAWVLENPVELIVAIGLATAVWMVLGLRSAPSVVWATIGALAFLTLSGENLSEVGRLWLPLMPPLVVAAGAGGARVEAKAAGLAATLVLLAVQTLVLQAMIQVVYPI